MSPDRLDLVPDTAFGHDFWAAPLWSWSPLVQHRLRAAVERAGTGDLVRYDETMRVSGNQLITIDITLTPLVTHDGISTIVCSIVDPTAALPADRHYAPDPAPTAVAPDPGIASHERPSCREPAHDQHLHRQFEHRHAGW